MILEHNKISVFTIHQIFSVAHDWSKRVMLRWLNMPQLKLGNISQIFPSFSKRRASRKIFEQKYSFFTINTIASIWCENMLGYLSSDIICYKKRTVFGERTVFSCQMQVIGYIHTSYATLWSGIPWNECLYQKIQVTSGTFKGIPRESVA